MARYIRQYVRNCDPCGRVKPWRTRLQGLLRPLPVPERIWQELSVDFIDKLPESNGCKSLMVITDRLSKAVLLFEMTSTTAEDVARVFIQNVYRHHGLPRSIVSDRGPQFVGRVWKVICKLLRVNLRLSTAFHPPTDGATERKNSDVEVAIRLFAESLNSQ